MQRLGKNNIYVGLTLHILLYFNIKIDILQPCKYMVLSEWSAVLKT